MSTPSPTLLRRLAFARSLFHIGAEQINSPEPMSSVGVLQLHDCVELFLQLAVEHLNAPSASKKTEFMQYFDLLNGVLAPKVLAHTEGMRRLNKTRVALKHDGVIPGQADLEGFRASVDAFLEENTPQIFNVAFSEISLATLIVNKLAQDRMLAADAAITSGDYGTALEAIAVAFQALVSEYLHDDRYPDNYPYLRHIDRRDLDGINSRVDLADFLNEFKKAFEQLRNNVSSLSLGLDIMRLRRFRRLTPSAAVATSGVYDVWHDERFSQTAKADVLFCYSFVIDSALKLQRIQ